MGGGGGHYVDCHTTLADIAKHVSQFKLCTIKVCESDTAFHGDNVFHMHIDGKIGVLEDRNFAQQHMSRMLFSIVTDTLAGGGEGGVDTAKPEYGTTCYPVWQPRTGFHSNQDFHRYMQETYLDRGLENSGLPRCVGCSPRAPRSPPGV
jgi:hypothetical protein